MFWKDDMPPLFKVLLKGLVQGVAIGWTILAILLIGNFFGLGERIIHSSDKYLALFLIAFSFFLTFGSVGMGIAVMGIPHDDDEPRGGHKMKTAAPKLVPQAIQIPRK